MSDGKGPLRVRECMHAGIVSCPPEASLEEVARVMSDHRVHAVAVADVGHGRPWGTWHIVTDLDLVGAVAAGRATVARQVAGSDATSVSADRSLIEAARLMAESRLSHLVVTHEAEGFPIGILSSLDIASAVSRGDMSSGRAP